MPNSATVIRRLGSVVGARSEEESPEQVTKPEKDQDHDRDHKRDQPHHVEKL
jgi:hypothetical protein